MKSISVRNVPDEVYVGLQVMAKTNRRSLQEQVKLILEREVKLTKGSFVTNAIEWRKRLQDRKFTDTVVAVREDRER